MHKKQFRFTLYLLWILLLLVLSLKPNVKDVSIDFPYFDKIAHFGFYVLASILFMFYAKVGLSVKWAESKIKKFNLLFHIGLGVLIEFVQHYLVPNRYGEFADAIANSLGVLIGLLIYQYLKEKFANLKT